MNANQVSIGMLYRFLNVLTFEHEFKVLTRFAKHFFVIFLANQILVGLVHYYKILKPSIKVTASATNEAT